MYARHTHTHDCIDDDHREPSPSTGWRETALLLDAPLAHVVEPIPDAGLSPVGVAV